MKVFLPLTVTANSYSAGQCVGGKLSLGNLTSQSPVKLQACAVVDAVLLDKAGNAVPYDLVFFDDDLSSAPGDRTAFVVADADRSKVAGHIALAISASLGAPSGGNGGVVLTATGLYKRLELSAQAYAVLIARGTPTFASAADLALKLIVEPAQG
jgi:hypothetical protein